MAGYTFAESPRERIQHRKGTVLAGEINLFKLDTWNEYRKQVVWCCVSH